MSVIHLEDFCVTPAVIAVSLEAALNPILRLDPEILPRLAALDGNVIAIEPEGLALTFYLLPNAKGIRVMDRYEGTPTVHIRGTPLALAQQWRNPRLIDDEIVIEGDALVGREFQVALARLEIDWEEQLSRLIGDVAARQMGRFWRSFRNWRQHTGDTLLRNGAEYLQQERQALPPRYAVAHFLSAVDTLRDDADRLTARIECLRQQLSPDASA